MSATLDELVKQRKAYKLALRTEPNASPSVRRSWQIVLIALDEAIRNRLAADQLRLGSNR